MNLVEIAQKFPTQKEANSFFLNQNVGQKVFFVHIMIRKSFSVTTKNYLHQTHIPLQTWLFAFAVVSDAKKGLSALQLQRHLGLSYPPFDMYHTIRVS
jgi:hypothetical protein